MHTPKRTTNALRQRLLSDLPVTERRVELAGVSTAVLEGGVGRPVVLLHGPGGSATHWMRVLPGLVSNHRVVAPDLPGLGASEVGDGPLDVDRVLAWLGALIAETCASPPVLVGQALGGAMAARFAVAHGERLGRLVLVGALGLAPFRPSPDLGPALTEFLTQPDERTHENLWRSCVHDLDDLMGQMGDRWESFQAYNLDRARTPSVQAALHTLLEQLAVPVAEADLARIAVPATLIWGRHDRAAAVEIGEAASARYGWPLRVIENAADPHLERPDAFLNALRVALGEEGAR